MQQFLTLSTNHKANTQHQHHGKLCFIPWVCNRVASKTVQRYGVEPSSAVIGTLTLSHETEMHKNPPDGVSVGLKDDDMFTWEVMVVGPMGTP